MILTAMHLNCWFVFNFQNVMMAFMAKIVHRLVDIASGKISVTSWTVPVLMDATVAIGENGVQNVKLKRYTKQCSISILTKNPKQVIIIYNRITLNWKANVNRQQKDIQYSKILLLL